MTLRAWIITMRGRVREALCPELQVLRDRLAHERARNGRLTARAMMAEANAREWKGNAENEARFARIDRIDARRGRWLLDKMRHQQCGPHEGWTLTNIYPGDDAAAAIDAAMDREERNDE